MQLLRCTSLKLVNSVAIQRKLCNHFRNFKRKKKRSKEFRVRTRAAVVLAFLLLEDDEENEGYQIERQYWVQPCLAKREQFGAFHTIFQEIRNDPKRCREYIRMNNNQFLYLVGLMSPDLQKQDNKMKFDSKFDCYVIFFQTIEQKIKNNNKKKIPLFYRKDCKRAATK